MWKQEELFQMTNSNTARTSRRSFLANTAALGTIMGLGTVAATVPRSSFAASRPFASSPHGCASKHAEIAERLISDAQCYGANSTDMNYALKTSHCSDCGTHIRADMLAAR